MGRLFGTDGVRGTYGTDLTDDLARRLGFAAATVLGVETEHPRILIGRDTRASGPALERALAAGIGGAGGQPILAGVLPTAGVAYLVDQTGATAGAVISASHNPARDNGIKFFGHDGMKLADEVEQRIEEALGDVPAVDVEAAELADADDRYIAFLLKDVPSLAGLRVVVDCANGAAANIAPEVYRDAGADVTAIFCDPDGTNINDGCGSTHPEQLQAAVRSLGAHLGLAHDGDADRVLAVDAHGTLVDGDQILGICALDAAARDALDGGAIVTTVMANLGLRRAMADAGIALIETAVGDRYVLEALREHRLLMGGEQSGHIIFLDRHTTGDGILTALRLMSVIATSGRDLSDLALRIPRFPQVLRSIAVRDRSALPDATQVWDTVGEVERALGDRGRVLVRASGTENLVRVMAEAETQEQARAVVDQIAEVVATTMG